MHRPFLSATGRALLWVVFCSVLLGSAFSTATAQVPNAPNAAAATAITQTSFSANWTAGNGTPPSGYILDVATDAGFGVGTFVAGFDSLDVGFVTTTSVTGLTLNSTYYYRLRAYAAGGLGPASSTITVTTLPNPPVAPVASVASNVAQTSFSANWGAASGASGYRIDVSTDIAFGSFVGSFNNFDVSNVTTFSVTGLSPGTQYYYRLRAYNAGGASVNSNQIGQRTLPNVPVTTAATSVAQTSFTANWGVATGAAGYRLDVATDAGFVSFLPGYSDLDLGNVTSTPVSGASAGVTYYYRVRAYNTGVLSANSNSTTLTTLANVPVATSASQVTESSLTANWSAANGASGYRLDVATNSGFTTFVAGDNDRDVANVTNFSVTGLSPNTTYWYRVRAYNSLGAVSASSNAISQLTTTGIPTAGAATNILQTSFTANWSSVPSASGYRLDVASDTLFTSILTGYNDLNVGSFTSVSVTGLTANTPYFYRVRSYNGSGSSNSSSVIKLTTLPDAPAAPTANAATVVTTTSFSANWTAAAGATSYRLDVATDAGFSSFVSGFNNLNVLNVTTYSVTGLAPGTTYYYRLRAVNTGGTSGNSGTMSTATIPSAPVVGAATGATTTSFSANWTASSGATGYHLDVATNSGFTAGTFVAGDSSRDVANVTTFSVTGLAGGTTYYYRVRAYNAGGTSVNSGVTTTATLAGAPTANAATVVTTTSFSANWGAVAGATSYRLDVATDIGFTAFVIGYNDLGLGNVVTQSVTGLTAGTTYYYRVRAVNGGGTSGNSNTITSPTIPSAPVVGAATGMTGTSFSANWTAAAGATGYFLDVATNIGFTAGTFVVGDSSRDVGNVATFSATGLAGGTTYYYRVRAYNAGGTSVNSGVTTTATLAGAPTATAATAFTTTSFSANWGAVASATSYRLDVATDIGFTAFVIGYTDLGLGNVVTSSVTGLTAGTTYYYRVRAVNAGGTTGNSNTITTATLPVAPVAAQATLVAQTTFSANWGATAGATGYILDVGTNPAFTGGTFVAGDSSRDVGNVTTFSVTGLTAGTTYYYRVRAYDGSGAGANSGTITTTTLVNVPVAPVAAVATLITQTTFSANWAASATATGYRLDVSTDVGFATYVAGDSARDVGNVLTFGLTGLTAGTPYYYRVRAYNTGGSSANSNAITLATLPTIPGSPLASAATSVLRNSFAANWSAVAGATGYRLDVSTNSGFTTYVTGDSSRDVGNVTTFSVTGLTANTPYYYRVRAYNTGGTSASSNTITVTTLATLAITSTSPRPSAIAGTAYTDSIKAVGGALPYTWGLVSGALPLGLTLNTSTGVITGIPTTVGVSSFSIRVYAAANVDSATAAFVDTVKAGAATNIALGTGDLQSVTVLSVFPAALTATVTDALGNPVPNTTVTFTSPSTGANGTFAGGVRSIAVLTNASGVATAPAFTANTIAGAYSDTAKIGSGSLVTYRLTNLARPAYKVRVETLANGTGIVFSQNVSSGAAVTVYAIARDTLDNFIGNQAATWTLTPTGGVLRTDLVPANGVPATSATFTGGVVGTAVITASITGLVPGSSGLFSVIVAGVPTKIRVETAANGTGIVLPDTALTSGRTLTVYAIARDNANNFVRNIPALWSLTGVTGGITATDLAPAAGVLSPNATLAGHVRGTARLQADSGAIVGTLSGLITVRAGNPAAIAATAGSLQSAAINTAFAIRLAATVTDTSGNPVPAKLVTFTAPAATGPSGTFAGGVNTATTDTNGVATAPIFTANTKAGIQYDTARVVGVPLPAIYTLTNTSGAAATLVPRPHTTPQHVPIGSAVDTALAVTVLDAALNPVAGVSVTFTAPKTPATGFPTSQIVVSDINGIATLPAYQANGIAGPDTVVATAPGVLVPAQFIIIHDAGSGQSIFITLGGVQTTPVKARFTDSLQVRVTDGANGTGNGVPNLLITFTAPPAGPTGFFRRTGNQIDTVRTNATGYAISSAFTADSVAGKYDLLATTGNIGTVAFSLTNAPLVASKLLVEGYPTSGPVSTQVAGVPFDILVTAVDVYNNPSTIVALRDSINITSNAPLQDGGGVYAFNGSQSVQTLTFLQAGLSDTIKIARVGGTERGRSNAILVQNPLPVVSSVTPPNARKGQIVDVVISGTGFLSGITTPSFGVFFTLNSWTVVNSQTMNVNMLIKANAPDSAYDVTVFNPGPGGGSGVLKLGFSVGKTPSPKIDSLLVSTGTRLSTFDLVIRGSGFFGGVTSVNMGAGITVNTTTVDSINQMTANVTIGVAAALGPRNVIVLNTVPAGTGVPPGADTAKNKFTVLNPVPVLNDVAQTAGSRLDTLQLTFTGSNFIPGCTVSFGDTGMVILSSVVDTTFRLIAVHVAITPGAFTGAHTASVTNPAPGGGTANLAASFTVINPVPSLTALIPNTGSRLQTLNVVMKGRNFVRGVTQVFFRDGITLNTLHVDSTTQMTANVTVIGTAVLGDRLVLAYNPLPGGDSSGTQAFTVTPPASPIPVPLSPPNANLYQPASVRLIWSSSLGANGYIVQLSKAANGTFQPVDTTFNMSDTTGVVISLSVGAKYYWHVASTNALGATSVYSPTWSFTAAYAPQVTVRDTVTFRRLAAAADYAPSDFRMFGLPGSSVVPVEKYFTGTIGQDWFVIGDNGAASNYWVPFASGAGFNFGSGRAFWVVNKGNLVLKDSVLAATLDTAGNSIVPLHAGWNIITSPFAKPVLWSAIIAANPPTQITHRLTGYRGGFRDTTYLIPYEGFYFENTDNLASLKIPFGATVGPVAAKASVASSWSMRINLTADAYVDRVAILGVLPQARVGRDSLDGHRPMGFDGIPVVVFNRPEWDAASSAFGSDYRPPINGVERWEFDVRSKMRVPVRLDFDGVPSIPTEFAAFLIDADRARSVDLKAGANYAFTPATDMSHFSIVVGTPAKVKEQLDAMLPREFALGNNFPNPFNPETTIPVSLPRAGEIRLTVYNILGEEVRTLYAGSLDAGKYWFKWDGRSERGNTVASGVYFVRLSAAGVSFVQKMSLLK